MTATTELQAWLNGTVNGGPNGDGKYPMTAKDGQVFLVYCPAAQALNPSLSELPVELYAEAAEDSASNAAASASAADTARIAAQTAASDALAYRNAASTSASNAAGSASTASTGASNASGSATAASGSASTASSASTSAVAARDLAQKWATENDDVVVAGGQYSAKHWAGKAATSAGSINPANYAPTTRTINTTAPLTGGGDLSGNRTLAISAATTSAAGSMSAADKTKLNGVAAGATVGATWGTNLNNIPANITSWAGIAPSAKQNTLGYTPVNKAGDTMTGCLVVNVAGANDYLSTTRSGYTYHWANLGDGRHAIYDVYNNRFPWVYNGASGGSNDFAGTLHEGGSRVWSEARFNPATKVNKAGDTMTGTLWVTPSGNDYLVSSKDGYSFAWYNPGTGTIGLYDATAGASAWHYYTGGGGFTDFRGAVKAAGFTTEGGGAGYWFVDRTSSRNWAIYGTGDQAHIWNGYGNTFSFTSTGSLVGNGSSGPTVFVANSPANSQAGGYAMTWDGFRIWQIGIETNADFKLWTYNNDGSYAGNPVSISRAGVMTVSGGISTAGNVTAYASDIRLKTNIKPYTGTALYRLEVVDFDWDQASIDMLNPGFKPDAVHEVGMIAQQVGEEYPLAMVEHSNGVKTIRWEKLVPLLVAEVQRLHKRVTELENK